MLDRPSLCQQTPRVATGSMALQDLQRPCMPVKRVSQARTPDSHLTPTPHSAFGPFRERAGGISFYQPATTIPICSRRRSGSFVGLSRTRLHKSREY